MGDRPHIWVLWRRRKGDLEQMLSLVSAVGWTYEIKQLDFRWADIPVLAPLLLKRSSDPLTPPWPDLVMCAEALPSIIARDIKHKSGGTVKTVCIGRPAGTPDAFDLVITTAQYRIPKAANVVELPMPLCAHSAQEMAAAYPDVAQRPLIAVLVGGPSFPDRLDAEVAERMAREFRPYAERSGGTLAFVTSPRTPDAVIAALSSVLAPPHRLHVFGKTQNQYRPLLAAADQIIVTSDSASMVADALDTNKPVFVYLLPQRLGVQWKLTEWLYNHAVIKRSSLLWPVKLLFDAGVFEAAADRRLLFAKLVQEKRIGWFGNEPPSPQLDVAARDLAVAAKALCDLVARAAIEK